MNVLGHRRGGYSLSPSLPDRLRAARSDAGWQEALREQAALLTHTSNLYHTTPGPALARTLVESSFADRVFFCNSGTEANEAAIKFARKYQRAKFEREKAAGALRPPWARPASSFVAFGGGFHGRTMGALALTWKEAYRAPFQPVMPGVSFATYGDVESVRRVARRGHTAAVFVEPVQGEGGIHAASPAFLRALRQLCDEIGALLVFDEVQCGLGNLCFMSTGVIDVFFFSLFRCSAAWGARARCGRTRRWASRRTCSQPPSPSPAGCPSARGLAIGRGAEAVPDAAAPGAVLCTEAVASALAPGDHGSTFAGGPLVCRVAQHVVDRVQQPAFLEGAREGHVATDRAPPARPLTRPGPAPAAVRARGEQLAGGLRAALAGNKHVREVRGIGLLVGIQLDVPAGPVVDACRARGLLVITAGKGDVVRLVPPLVVSAQEVDHAVAILADCIATL